MDVVILAGGTCPSDLAAHAGVTNRSHLTYNGKTFLEIVLEVAKAFGEPIVVTDQTLSEIRTVAPGKSFVGSLRAGLEAVTSSQFLLLTSDLPFLTTSSVQELIDKSAPRNVLNYPIIPMERCLAVFPEFKRTAIRIKEGRFTGGNAAVIDTQMMHKAMPHVEAAYQNRKRPLALASQIGPGIILKFLASKISPGVLSIASLEHAVSQLLHDPVKAIICSDPAIGTDIDTLEQFLALQRLEIR